MAQIPWTEELQLGLPVIDEQHAHLMQALNALDTAVTHNQGAEAIARILGELDAHTRMHFAYEEELMRRQGYATAEMHAATHATFTDKVRALTTGPAPGAVRLLETQAFLIDWLARHIVETDRRYVALLTEKA